MAKNTLIGNLSLFVQLKVKSKLKRKQDYAQSRIQTICLIKNFL